MATSLRPPSTSPSPSPTPATGNRLPNRASMGASARLGSGNTPTGLNPTSPRPTGIIGGGGRPTSELVSSSGMFQTPEAEAIDQWFENLQNYEATLEEMAAASLDLNFKEELSAIEQWFRVLSEAERTAALYSLLQHSTQVQIRFFITVLQQMARSDPMTALLSPGMGGSMQSQMEAKLSSMGLKSPSINSPNARGFASVQRQSLAVESPNASSFLSPDAANLLSPAGPTNGSEAANTLAQQRAKLKANAAHRISAPAAAADGARGLWSGADRTLGQVVEGTSSPSNEETEAPTSSGVRPKSTDFAGLAASFRNNNANSTGAEEQLSPMVGGNWASMVNTPLVPMFNNQSKEEQTIDAAASRLANWSISNNSGGKMQLDDAKKYRRVSKAGSATGGDVNSNAGVYDENGNLVAMNGSQPGGPRGGARNVSGGGAQYLNAGQQQQQPWNGGSRSPSGFSNVSSNRFGGSDTDGGAGGMPPGFGLGTGLGSPLAGYMNMAAAAGMNMNMMAAGMGGMNGMLPPEMQTQILAAQLAAANGVFNPAIFGMQAAAAANSMRSMRGSSTAGGRSPGGGKSTSGRTDTKDEEVDPKLLEDIPAWLRSLRLHKYTPNFQNMNWKDMVIMDEAALEAKGVAALGARRKMLKTFENVRAKMGIEMQNPPAIPA